MSLPSRILLVLISMLPASALNGQELPPRAMARLGAYRFYHGWSIELVAMSSDGSRVASLARKPIYYRHITDKDRDPFDRTIVLWDAVSGQRLRELQAPAAPVYSLVFSPDGKRLLAVCGRAESKSHLVFFDVNSGKIVDEIGGLKEDARYPQFSADGKRLLLLKGYLPNIVESFDIAARKVHQSWTAPAPKSDWIKENELATHAVPSPDGKFIAWLVDVLPDYSKVPQGVRVGPWVPRPSIVVISDASTDKVLYRKNLSSHDLRPLVFSADSRWFMTCGDKKVTAWETATGKELFSLADPSPYGIALSPDGRFAVISGDWHCRVWDLATKKIVHELHGDLGHNHRGNRGQLFSADGRTLALWTGSTLRLYDTATGKERVQPGHRAQRIMVRFSADGCKLFSACDETRCTWEVSPGKQPTLLEHVARKTWEKGGSETGAHNNDSRFYVDEVNWRIRICETATGKVVHELEKDDWWGSFARFSPDGTRLALRRYLMERTPDGGIRGSNEPEVLRLYDTGTGKKSGEIKLINGLSWVVPVFSPDGKTLGWIDRANDVHLHDAVTGKLIQTLRSTQPLPRKECSHGDLLFSPDGRHVIVTTYWHEIFADPKDAEKWNTLPTRVFDVASGKEIRRFYGNPEKTRSAARFSSAACSPDNRLLAVAENESATIRLIEIDSGTVRAEFKGHRDGVHELAFSPDGKTLASGGEDNVIYLWDVLGIGAEPNGKKATGAEMAEWWTDLANAKKAEAAIVSFVRAGEKSIKFLSGQLRPVEPLDEKRLAKLLADLDSAKFAERQVASNELARFGYRIEDLLRKELQKMPVLEIRRRLEDILDKLDVSKLSLQTLQTLRAIEVLERIGNPDAVQCLQRLATGAPEAWETRAAKSAVTRSKS